jgi:hypothetical protein
MELHRFITIEYMIIGGGGFLPGERWEGVSADFCTKFV